MRTRAGRRVARTASARPGQDAIAPGFQRAGDRRSHRIGPPPCRRPRGIASGTVQDASRMLSDLHLNSITVGQLVSEAAKQLGLPRIVGIDGFCKCQRCRNRPSAH